MCFGSFFFFFFFRTLADNSVSYFFLFIYLSIYLFIYFYEKRGLDLSEKPSMEATERQTPIHLTGTEIVHEACTIIPVPTIVLIPGKGPSTVEGSA